MIHSNAVSEYKKARKWYYLELQMQKGFLPITAKEMREVGIEQP
ncbi:MAG: hypothetical protein RSC76_08365, partial [Oscillospiraceae bacterium]